MIDGNDDFLTQANAEGWPGDGTSSNPIIINGLTIIGSGDLIKIMNSNLYFQINNCIIKGGNNGNTLVGIKLTHAINGEIINNVIMNAWDGIHIFGGGKHIITNNYVSNCDDTGIYLEESNLNFIDNNIISHTYKGIWSSFSNNNTFSFNTVSNNGYTGIYLDTSEYNTFSNNNVSDNEINGIELWKSNHNNFSSNKISHNRGYGVHIKEVLGGLDSEDNRFHWNIFTGNNIGGLSQACDDEHIGTYTDPNVFSYNYWDDWTGPDDDSDGFVDNPYSLDGEGNNEDPYPLVSPITIPVTTESTTTSTQITDATKSTPVAGFTVVACMLIISFILIKRRR